MPLNDWFAGQHTIARQVLAARLTEGSDPLLIRTGSELVHWHHGRRRSTLLMTDRYDRAKAVNHVPAAMHLALRGRIGVSLTDAELTLLRELDADVAEAMGHLQDPEETMLAVCREHLRRILEEGSASVESMTEFAEAVQEPMGAVIGLATRAYLETLHAAVTNWTAGWDDDTWARLLVVICAGHAPRYKESTRTYFQRLLGESHGLGAKGEERVVYAEGIQTEDDAIQLGAEHLLNLELGLFFMKSSVGLQEDVLGDATRAILDELL